jgi:trimethylamine:corrinoid methyltransferase-like protein
MEERAAKMVDEILASHQVNALSPEVQTAIKQIIEREQAWIDNQR